MGVYNAIIYHWRSIQFSKFYLILELQSEGVRSVRTSGSSCPEDPEDHARNQHPEIEQLQGHDAKPWFDYQLIVWLREWIATLQNDIGQEEVSENNVTRDDNSGSL